VLGFVNYLWCEVVLNSPVLYNTKHQKLVFVREAIGPSASIFHVQIIQSPAILLVPGICCS
jgi:hypothetical protein